MTTPNEQKLLPCPFCGGVNANRQPAENSETECVIVCQDCGASGPLEGKIKCKKAWNTRADFSEKGEHPLVKKGAEAMGVIRFAAHLLGLNGPLWNEEPGFGAKVTSALLKRIPRCIKDAPAGEAKIQRYQPFGPDWPDQQGEVFCDDNGEYMLFTDHEAKVARLMADLESQREKVLARESQLREAVRELINTIRFDTWHHHKCPLLGECDCGYSKAIEFAAKLERELLS